MGLFDFLKKTKDDDPVRYSGVSKYLSGGNLPSDIKTLYDIGRYQMGENTRKEQNYFRAVEAFEKLCMLDKNFEYPQARKWLGQCYMAGKGVHPNVDKGIEYYDWWMERFLLHETDLVKVDDELRIYFDHGFHNYDFLLECANKRIQQEKGKNEYPIGKCLYEIFLPIWCYGNVSSEMNFYRYNIKKYLRFVVDNFGDKRIGYFAEDICRNRNASTFDIERVLIPYIKEGNIFALERYLNVCRKKGSKPSADLVSEKNQIWGKMARLQEKHDHEARFALREQEDKKFAEVREFFLGPSFELKGHYWYPHSKNSIYELRKQVDKNYFLH